MEFAKRDRNGIIDEPQEQQEIEFDYLDLNEKVHRKDIGVYSNLKITTKSGKVIPLSVVHSWRAV